MKMTIKSLLVLSLLALASTLSAQNPLSFAVSGGLNLSDYTGDIEDNKVKLGFNANLAVDYRLSKTFYLTSGIGVHSKGTKTKGSVKQTIPEYLGGTGEIEEQDVAKYRQTFNAVYLQVPLHVGYLLHLDDMKFLFHAGPYVEYGVGGKITTETTTQEDGTQKEKINTFGKDGVLKRWDLGLGVGVSYQYEQFFLNVGCDLGFLDAHPSDWKLKNNTGRISLGYRFQLL